MMDHSAMKKWPYWRDWDRATAEQHLKSLPLGTFVLRPSSRPNCLAFSQHDGSAGGGVFHSQILVVLAPHSKEPRGFCVGGHTEIFDSIDRLLSRLNLAVPPRAPPPASTSPPAPLPGNRPLLAARPLPLTVADLTLEPEPVGEGSFGLVFAGQCRGRKVAVKQLKANVDPGSPAFEEFVREAEIMKMLPDHVNVVKLIGVTPPPNLFLVLEFVDSGNLYELLQARRSDQPDRAPDTFRHRLSDAQVRALLLGVCQGLLHIHMHGVIHRDLAARNIMLDRAPPGSGSDQAFIPKLGDFGLARQLEPAALGGGGGGVTQKDTGPLSWMAPECIRDRHYSEASDCWALSVVLREVLDRLDDPYPDLKPIQVAMRVGYEGMRTRPPTNCSPAIADLIFGLTHRHPHQRISVLQTIQILETCTSITRNGAGL